MIPVSNTNDSTAFRLANFADANALKELIRKYYAFDGIPFASAEIETNLKVLLGDATLGLVWLCVRRAQIVGYLIVTFGFDLEFGGRSAFVTDFYLEPTERRKGLGRQMVGHLEEFCRQAGINALELLVERRNQTALTFYTACGFQTHDRIPMSKRLRPLPGIGVPCRVLIK